MYKRLPYLAMAVLSLAFALRAGPPANILHSWDIDAAKNTVTLHLINTTGKDITAYNIKIRETYGPHTVEHEISRDTVALMFNIQDLAGTEAGERLQKQFGNGTFASGTNTDEVVHVQPGLTDFSATVDAVIYADKTVETSNPEALKRLLDARASFASTILAGNGIIQRAIANPDDPNPAETALKQIQALESHHQGNAGALHELSEDLKRAESVILQGQSVRDYLTGYVAKRNERAARLQEHAKAGAQ